MSEGKRLSEQHEGEQADEWLRDKNRQAYYNNVDKMIVRHSDNASSPVGATIRCACCGRRILKKSYQTQFCSNKGKKNCKDKYHNNTNGRRRYRAQLKERCQPLWRDMFWEDQYEEDGDDDHI